MARQYRITFECYESASGQEELLSKTVMMSGLVDKPSDIFNFGMSHKEQIHLIQSGQDALLEAQISLADLEVDYCPHCCGRKLIKFGYRRSDYHDIFTDHKVRIGRKRCPECSYEPGSTIKTILGHSMSADLIKLQSELGSQHTFRESEQLFSAFSNKKRQINNHDRVKHTVEQVGNLVKEIRRTENSMVAIEPAQELVLNVDGGHIKTIEKGKRSFEAMTSVVYRPEALVSNKEGTRNHLTSKHCAASALNDGQQEMINSTIIAALKEGLSPITKVTALCDGAENCWKIAQALKPFAASISFILDWFHLSMKIQNIVLPEKMKPKLEMIKWHLWRGKTDNALKRLNFLIELCPDSYKARIKTFETYVKNNHDKIIDYRDRQKKGLVFTSNLAESTVESLINQRCKGQQHMRWSREGLDPLLQLRVAISSNDWNKIWKTAIKNIHSIH